MSKDTICVNLQSGTALVYIHGWGWGQFSKLRQENVLVTLQTLFRYVLSNIMKISVCWQFVASKIFIWLSISGTYWTICCWRLNADINVWSPCHNGSEVFWWHEEDLHNIRQVVFMLWLTGDWLKNKNELSFPFTVCQFYLCALNKYNNSEHQ